MRKRILVAVGGTVAAAAAVAAVGLATVGGAASNDNDVSNNAVEHRMAAEYPTFDSVGAITGKSAIVVRATVTEVGAAYREIPAGMPVDKLPAHKAAQVGVVRHDVTFRVDQVLKGSVAPGASVSVVHLGGQIGADNYVAEHEPSSTAGRSYLLFLVPVEPGKYGMVGGAQGRYLVEKNVLRNVDEHAATGVSKQLNGMNVAALQRDFAQLTAGTR